MAYLRCGGAAAVAFALLVAGGCEREPQTKTTKSTSAVSAATASSAPICRALPPVDAWRPVGADFFDARLPASFREVELKEAKGYRDDAGRRRIQFSPVELPAGQMDVTVAIDKLTEGVREQASDPALGLTLGSTLKAGTALEPVRYFVVTGKERTFVQGLVARRATTGRLHAVLVIYEDAGASATALCAVKQSKRLLETITLSAAVAGSARASGPSAPAPLVSLTPRAVESLRRETKPGETVWMGVNAERGEVSYLLDVGKNVPDSVEVFEVQGIRIAADRGSMPFLRGVTVDYVPGQGFSFQPPER